jgi:hypothetical protein
MGRLEGKRGLLSEMKVASNDSCDWCFWMVGMERLVVVCNDIRKWIKHFRMGEGWFVMNDKRGMLKGERFGRNQVKGKAVGIALLVGWCLVESGKESY